MMSDSDSEPWESYNDDNRASLVHSVMTTFVDSHPDQVEANIRLHLKDEWDQIPVDVKKKGAHLMRLCGYWLPILVIQHPAVARFAWGASLGLVNPRNPTILSLKMLTKIEALDSILKAIEVGTLTKEKMHHFLSINLKFQRCLPVALFDGCQWLEETGGENITDCVCLLCPDDLSSYSFLSDIFQDFMTYLLDMVEHSAKKNYEMLNLKYPEEIQRESECMKKCGNTLFQSENYQDAVNAYTKAIKALPYNHINFGNRALCYIRLKKYLEAAFDGKLAILIKPTWLKGHYRYCEALFMLGEVRWAFCANTAAQDLCQHDSEAVKELEQQRQRFQNEIKVGPSQNIPSAAESQKKNESSMKPEPASKSKRVETTTAKCHDNGRRKQNNNASNDLCKGTGERMNMEKNPVKEKTTPGVAKKQLSTPKKPKKPFNPNTQTPVCKEELRGMIKNACDALSSKIGYNAEKGFRHVLEHLECNKLEDGIFSPLDELLLLYGCVSALIVIGKLEKLTEAKKLLEKIQSYDERGFQCLVYYAYGKIYQRENKFAVAQGYFQDSLQIVKNQIIPCKLTWPLTKEIVKETDPEYFEKILEDCIHSCKYPPQPDGVCRLENCLGPCKNMYLTDPESKGFVQLKCSQECLIEYHNACWKAHKPESFEKSNTPCPTPDCSGVISSVKMIDQTGLVKHTIVLDRVAESPKKTKVIQKSKGVKEKKCFKRENKKSLEKKVGGSDETQVPKINTIKKPQQNAWRLYQDRVLLQIHQMMQLFRQETGLSGSAVSASLRPWLELDSARGDHLASKMLNWEEEPLEKAVELLLERKNRVWARIFIHLMSSTLQINPELSQWAGRLNDADLKAAKSFIEHNADSLDELDLTPLLSFVPLKEMISSSSNLVSGNGLINYVKQTLPHEMRIFIWTLEEHKDLYVSCNASLDKYFDMIDGHCAVLKKSDNQNSFPANVKSRGRKRKNQRVVERLNVPRSEEYEGDHEEPIYSLDPNNPFRVPRNLEVQVANFEEQYNRTKRTNLTFLDNNPDPIEENLYSYFAQILKKHGPLHADDPLLLGEMENFPPEALAKIEKAGGIKGFLEQSLRFISFGALVALAEHAVVLHDFSNHCSKSSDASSPMNLNIVVPDKSIHMDEGIKKQESMDLYTSDESCKKDAEVQTYQTIKNCVAINTEPLQPYESVHGDINNKVKSIRVMDNYIRQIQKESEEVDQKHHVTLESLNKEIQEISTKTTVTHKELTMFQQKLKEEVKNGQKEKAANQEELKALKMETEKLVGENASLTKRIKKGNDCYKAKFSELLELSNHLAAEKMSLEDKIERYKNSVAVATSRSHASQLSVLKTSWDQRLYGLNTQLKDAKIFLTKLDENVQRFPQLEAYRPNARAKVQEVEQKIATTRASYEKELLQVKNGKRVTELLSVNQTDTEVSPLCSGIASLSIGPSKQAASEPKTRRLALNIMLTEAEKQLGTMFPNYNRSDFKKFFKESSWSNGSSLNLQEVVNIVSQKILDSQGATAMATPDLDPPRVCWKTVYQKPAQPRELNLDDPCIICLDEIRQDDRRVIECGHTFHSKCIKQWMMNNSTCPTCRQLALPPDDFPALRSCRRKAP
ncbi:E3 ubiquitin-protein ligase TTC3 isoform X1 [Stigmatopora argus]